MARRTKEQEAAYRASHKEAIKASRKRFHAAHPDRVAQYMRTTRYGLTQKAYDEMRVSQLWGCAICGVNEEVSGGPHSKLNIDHDHETGEVRGLLCKSCNIGLGYFEKSKGLLWRALIYAEK